MWANYLITNFTDRVNLYYIMVVLMMENGRMTYDMAMEPKLFRVDINTMVNTIKVNNMERAYLHIKKNIK